MTSFKSLRKLAVTLLCTMFTPLFATDGDVSMDKTPHLKSLQDVPFCSWDGWGANAVPTGNADCAWVVGEPTYIPYGDAYIINYADLSAYDRLVVTVTEGSARLLFNRDIEEGQWDENEAESHLIDNTKGGWSEKYFFSETKEDGSTVWIVDLALMVKEKGFAHLHAIKGANWENVTVTSMVLQKLTISLQDVPFCSWDGWGANAIPTGYADCAWVVGEPTGIPYGDANVINYADLSAYDRLVVTVTEGTARLLFNRDIEEGQWSENEAESHLIDNTKGGWSDKYFFSETKEDGSTVCTVDLALMVKDKGFAHLHAIKGANWVDVTVTSMVLQIIPQGQTTNTHTLTITAAGNGYVTYDGNTVRDNTSVFSVEEGTNAILKFAADESNRVKSVMVNGMDVTSQVADDQITISNITEDTNVEVVFEAILPTTYSLSITASGNGSVVYDGKNVRNNTSTFNVEGGTNAILKFSADEGNRVKSVKINNQDVTTTVVNNQYTINNVKANTKVEVVFEALPYYSLNIIASGNGSATYNGTTIRNQSQAFTIREGSSAVVSFTSDNGYRIKSVIVNGMDMNSQVIDNQITISNIKEDTNVEVVFEEIPQTTYEINPNPTEIVVHAVERDNLVDEGGTGHPWDNGFWIVANRTLKAGEKTIIQFKYKSSIPAHTTTQCHAQPDEYLYYEAIGDIEFSEQWQNFKTTFVVPAYADGMQSIDILMAHIKEACDYYIKDVVWKLEDNTESLINDEGVDNFYVKEGANMVPHVYDPNGYTPPTIYTLSITSSGNGYVAYDGNTVRGKTSSFSVVEGTNAILKFSADEGNRLKNVKVNGQDVTSTIVNNQYTIDNIKANKTIEVVFETIPNYSLNVVATGNGKATYNGTAIRNQSQSFTLREGYSAIISFTADAGYRIKSVAVNSTDVTSQVVNEQITISNITKNTNVEVSFEEIPPTTYSLTIKATGNGAVTYDGQNVRGGASTFTVVEGSYATVLIVADDGYRLKHVLLDSKNVTADVADGQYTTTKIMANMTLTVEFEAIPTYTLSIKSSAFGSVRYGDAVITDQTQTFTVREGTSAVLMFMADGNGRLQYITLNGNDITGQLSNGQYTINNIKANQSVEAVYDVDITKVTNAGVAYTVTSYDEQTVVVAAGTYGNVLIIPASFTAKDKTWTVTGIDSDALSSANELAAIIWDPEVAFAAEVSNPNLLLYVKKAEYAPTTIQNVIVNDLAEKIVLREAVDGNSFYCPKPFTARRVSYEHNYSMISGYSDCQGWETLVLPFDVSMIISNKGTELVPYSTWKYGSSMRPFWLYQLTENGWQAGDGIKANTPYIVSLPNNEMYQSSYNIMGNIQFIGNNVEVKASTDMTTGHHGNKRLVANYQTQGASADIYALNVSNKWCQNTAAEKEGSTFIRSLRSVHPFEAYMTVEGSNAPWAIPVFENGTTGVSDIMFNVQRDEWHTIDGRKLQGEPKKKGIYLHNGKKVRK